MLEFWWLSASRILHRIRSFTIVIYPIRDLSFSKKEQRYLKPHAFSSLYKLKILSDHGVK